MTPADLLHITIPAWMDDAACLDPNVDRTDFHPEGVGGHIVNAEKRAKEVCAGCDVRLKCLQWQMDYEAAQPNNFRWGVFGGLNGVERGKLARAAS